MDRFASLLFTAVLSLGLAACSSSNTGYPVDPTPVPAAPRLQDFYLVDSDGFRSDSAPNYEPIIDATIAQGQFEVYWRASSFYDYRVTFAINDRPSMVNSFILSEEICGAGLSCDLDGMQACEYTLDGFMGCGSDLFEADRNLVFIDEILVHFPEYLYLNIEICDRNGLRCTVDWQPVTVF
jgi:hypothetical protein